MMSTQRLFVIGIAVLCTVAVASLVGPSNVDPVDKWSWSENEGWLNWRDADSGNGGVVVEVDHLHGNIWAENLGWINVGDGSGPYSNASGLDFGVNRLGNDDLDGMAWSENGGWINFGWAANTADANRARFDVGANRFRGFAWGENIGWITLDDATHFVATEALAPPALVAEPIGADKERAISFVVPSEGAGNQTALRVLLNSLHTPGMPVPVGTPDFSAEEGTYRYVNLFRDESNNPVTVCPDSASFLTTYRCATLSCVPEYADWAGLFGGETIHVTGSAIVPDSVYQVAQLAASCGGNEAACSSASAELAIATVRWGNSNGDGGHNVTDVVLVVDRVRDILGAISEPRALVRDELLNPVVESPNVQDIVFHVDALRGFAYPFAIPACP